MKRREQKIGCARFIYSWSRASINEHCIICLYFIIVNIHGIDPLDLR